MIFILFFIITNKIFCFVKMKQVYLSPLYYIVFFIIWISFGKIP